MFSLHTQHQRMLLNLVIPRRFLFRRTRLTDKSAHSSIKSNGPVCLKQNTVCYRNVGVALKKCSCIVPSNLAKSLLDNVVFSATPSNLVFQVRNCKTDRTVNDERFRNPNLFTRILSLFRVGGNPSSVVISSHELDREGTILSKQGSSEEDLNKINKALATMYLIDKLEKTQRTLDNLRKAIYYIITIILFSGLGFLIGASDKILSIRFGNHAGVESEKVLRVTFNDVKGADEIKQELKDVVEFVKNPVKFSSLGAELPRGVLLVGPPGTGKTLLARAVAGEAGVPFFYAAGSEFDDMFVGQGAKRIRDLFEIAREKAPCIIFIDEIDSIGAKRTDTTLNPYSNQTINQLLSEMDGVRSNEGVIVIGATNRRDDLDKALLRPGRFDMEVSVPIPDYSARKEILSLYLGKICAKNVDIDILTRGTIGLTGADLKNMINQAAVKATIDGADFVTMSHMEFARDKIMMGPERKSKIQDDETNQIIAHHEAGHAIVAYYTKDSVPLHKMTIIPRGQSLGHTAYIPDKERYHVTKSQLLATIDTMMGGRAAEELIFGSDKITTGAYSDLKQATIIASQMVKDWGMSEKAGQRTYDSDNQGLVIFNQVSPHSANVLDSEVDRILKESYERAKTILNTHHEEHRLLADALIKYETLDANEIKDIIHRKMKPEKNLLPRQEKPKKLTL